MTTIGGWPMRLDPTISWGDMIMAFTLIVGGLFGFAHLSARVDVHDERIAAIGVGTNGVHDELRQHIVQEATERSALRAEIKEDLNEIKGKLDRLVERELDGKVK